MSSTRVIEELTELFRKNSQLRPDTSRWIDPIDRLMARGCTTQQIIGAAKYALTSMQHRNPLLDKGPIYIEWNYNQLVSIGDRRHAMTSDDVQYGGGRHKRWEVELHKYRASEPVNPLTTTQWLERYMNANNHQAYDLIVCPICSTEAQQYKPATPIKSEDDELWEDVA